MQYFGTVYTKKLFIIQNLNLTECFVFYLATLQ